ncbi:MAG: hypothetical protein WBD63_01190 [Phycisphaerae bacterium]|nr:hypothetical protein [Phycisphaerae bacterium]
MYQRASIFLLPLVVLGTAQGCTSEWPRADLAKAARDVERYGEELGNRRLRLSVHDVASLPDGVVFVAGDYGNGAGSFRSVLLVSRDGGRSWQETGPAFGVSAIRDLRTLGRRHVWAIATFTGEGCCTPEVLLRSTDAGRTWATTDLGAIQQDQPLFWVERFVLDDASYGLLTITGSMGRTRTYATKDGGRTWRLLWSVPSGSNGDVEVSPQVVPASVKRTPLWTRVDDAYDKISGWLRVRPAENAWVVEACPAEDETGEWTERSRLPMHYQLDAGRLAPCETMP